VSKITFKLGFLKKKFIFLKVYNKMDEHKINYKLEKYVKKIQQYYKLRKMLKYNEYGDYIALKSGKKIDDKIGYYNKLRILYNNQYVEIYMKTDIVANVIFFHLPSSSNEDICFSLYHIIESDYIYIILLEKFPTCSNIIINSGKELIDIIKLIAKKFNIPNIILIDGSTIPCNGKKNGLNLAKYYTFRFGDTWYGNLGFLPYRKELVEIYNTNKQIIQTTLINNIDFTNLLSHVIKYYQDKQSRYNHNSKLIKHYQSLIDYINDNTLKFNEFIIQHNKESPDKFYKKFYEFDCYLLSLIFNTNVLEEIYGIIDINKIIDNEPNKWILTTF
jgi:hypothetical protein